LEINERYKLKVEVTESNIYNGTKRDSSHCPIALALKDKGYSYPIVGVDGLIYTYGNKRRSYYIAGLKARKFIKKFDNDEIVGSGTFRIYSVTCILSILGIILIAWIIL
jgi:hypothetical protein